MEPRSFKRGNGHLTSLDDKLSLLQWSHVHSNVETFKASRMASIFLDGFNGATFIQTWKHSTDQRL